MRPQLFLAQRFWKQLSTRTCSDFPVMGTRGQIVFLTNKVRQGEGIGNFNLECLHESSVAPSSAAERQRQTNTGGTKTHSSTHAATWSQNHGIPIILKRPEEKHTNRIHSSAVFCTCSHTKSNLATHIGYFSQTNSNSTTKHPAAMR